MAVTATFRELSKTNVEGVYEITVDDPDGVVKRIYGSAGEQELGVRTPGTTISRWRVFLGNVGNPPALIDFDGEDLPIVKTYTVQYGNTLSQRPWDIYLDVRYSQNRGFRDQRLRVTQRVTSGRALRISSIAADGITIRSFSAKVNIKQPFNGTVYMRVTRKDGKLDPIFRQFDVTTGDTVTASAAFLDLFPNTEYFVDASDFDNNFNPGEFLRITVKTSNVSIGGVSNALLLAQDTEEFWQAALGVRRFNMFVGNQPAGYSPPTTQERTIKRVEIMRALAGRFFCGLFEDRLGGWDMRERRSWKDRPITARFRASKFSIIDRVYSFDVREDLLIRLVSYRRHLRGNLNIRNGLNVWDFTTETRTIQPSLEDLVSGRTSYNLGSSLFVVLDSVPGALDPMFELQKEDAPEVAVFEVSAAVKDGTSSAALWAAAPGSRCEVEIEGQIKTGIVMQIRYVYHERQLPYHQVTMIVHSTRSA